MARARKIQKFLSQPFHVAEVFTGTPGVFVKLEDTIKAFKGIVAGDYDDLPEQAFYMVGPIDEAVTKAKKLAAEEFVQVDDVVRTFPVRFADAQDLITFLTAWGWDEREVSEMPLDHRAAFEAELTERLRPRTAPSGIEDLWTIHYTVARA